MTIFQENDYRNALRAEVRRTSRTFMDLARSTGIHTSYFSRVMKEKAHFSADQVYAILQTLGTPEEEAEYVLLLREHDCAINASRRETLARRIRAIQEERRSLRSRLDMPSAFVNETTHPSPDEPSLALERKGAHASPPPKAGVLTPAPGLAESYYFDTITAKVHVALSIPAYRDNRFLLAERLRISQRGLQEALERLERLGLVRLHPDRIELLREDVHLDDAHPLSPHNHVLWRLEAIERLRGGRARKGYSFSVCFTADDKALLEIRERFKEFVLEIKELVDARGPGDSLQALTFDIFAP